MKCPNCNETLLMTERNNIEIDYCPSCRGVWLDKGELDKMLDYASQNASPSQNLQQYDQKPGYPEYKDRPDYKDKQYQQPHGHQKPHKKKSFLGDLFDFD